LEVLVSRKIVSGAPWIEGSEITNSVTDGQKLNMRLNCTSKHLHHCKAKRTLKV